MPNRKLPPNDEVVALYRCGMSSGEIAEKFDVKPITVNSLLRRIGEPRRSLKESAKLRAERGRWQPSRSALGTKQSPELIERRISKIRGERHWLWKGGNSRRPYRKVVGKDRCAKCGAVENLVIHHADLDHFNNEPSNLVVLCASCHQSLHKKAYWEARRAGHQTPKSNGPVGWTKQKKGGAK